MASRAVTSTGATGDLDAPDGPGSPGTAPGRPSGERGPRLHPAWLVVIPLVAATVLGGGAALLVTALHTQVVLPTSPPIRADAGSGLAARPAGADFRPVGSEPPADVLSSVPVPEAARRVSYENTDNGAGPYDRTVVYASALDATQLVAFYRDELRTEKWSVKSDAPDSSGTGRQILAQRPSRDGFYWELGVDVHQTAAGSPPSTGFELRLVENTDQ
jgi:hypothetical protein